MSIESSLCNYSHVYSLVKGNITVTCAISAAGKNHIQRNQPFAAATQVVHHVKFVKQKSIILLLMKEKSFTL